MMETMWYDWNSSSPPSWVALEKDEEDCRALFKYPFIRSYSEYFKYYTDNPYDGVIIKADNDIVYVNLSMVRPFADYIWNHEEIFLLSASVVNQEMCAYQLEIERPTFDHCRHLVPSTLDIRPK
jgi:hypothetical protein